MYDPDAGEIVKATFTVNPSSTFILFDDKTCILTFDLTKDASVKSYKVMIIL